MGTTGRTGQLKDCAAHWEGPSFCDVCPCGQGFMPQIHQLYVSLLSENDSVKTIRLWNKSPR